MPIFSAAANLTIKKDALFVPSTEITGPEPAYAFFFDEPAGFNQRFTFDNCVQFTQPSYPVVCDGFDFDLNRHNLHYRRLFKLTYLSKSDPKYYLIPWLAVPFFQSPTTPNKFTSAIPSFPLRVTAESIYENRVNKRVKKNIEDANSVSPRKLTLAPSSPAIINAVWNKSGTDTIDEIDCLKSQDITITIADSANYDYQEYVTIEDNLGTKLGRLRLLFLERIEHKVVFMNSVMSSKSVLQISMLATTSTPPHDYITDLNSLFHKTGIEHVWVDDVLTIQSPTGATQTFGPGSPVDLVADSPVDFSKSDHRENHIVKLIHDKLVKQIVGAENYLFVCFANWAFIGGPVQGISNQKGRTSCIFNYSKSSLCHEAAHALGLPHYFFEDEVDGTPPSTSLGERESVKKLALEAKLNLIGFDLATEKKLEKVHDAMNLNNACDELEKAFMAVTGRTDEISNVSRLFHTVDVDRFVGFNTRNLMDYLRTVGPTGPIPVYLKEKLVKHQLEFMRFFITNKRIQ